MEIYVCKQPLGPSTVENMPSDIEKYLAMPTVGSKNIRALAIILAIFLWFDCQSHASYK